jgi:tetratricopeptide (TPR) repeat protein
VLFVLALIALLPVGCASPPPPSLAEQGDAAFERGAYREADRLYSEAIRVRADDPWALYGSARTALRLHDPERSLGLYARLDRADREFFRDVAGAEYARTLRAAGLARLDAGRTGGAVKAFRALRQVDPNEKGIRDLLSRALTAYGQDLVMHGRREEAMKIYREAIALTPRSAAPYVGAAEILISTGRRKDALALLQGAREHNPTDSRVRALTVEAMGLY